MDEKHPQSIYGESFNDDESSLCEDAQFLNISLKLAEINRTVASTEDKLVRHEDALENITSILRGLQDSQAEISNTLARVLVRFRKHAYNKRKVQELVRCNKELAVALSKKLYTSEFKRKKIPYTEGTFEGVIHPSALPYVYLDSHPSDDEEDDLYFGLTVDKRK